MVWMNVPEASRATNVTMKSIYNMVTHKSIPFVHIDNSDDKYRLYVKPEDVRACAELNANKKFKSWIETHEALEENNIQDDVIIAYIASMKKLQDDCDLKDEKLAVSERRIKELKYALTKNRADLKHIRDYIVNMMTK